MKKSLQRFTLLCILIATHTALGNAATVIVSADNVSTNMGEVQPPAGLVTHLIDQSGLSSGFVSGVTDFDSYMATNPTHSSFSGNDWLGSSTSGVIDFTFNSPIDVDRVVVWNMGFNSSGIRLFDLLTSVDGSFSDSVNRGTFELSDPSPNPAEFEIIDFTGVASGILGVRFDVFSSYGPGPVDFSLIAAGEVAFEQVPEPTGIAMISLGLVGSVGTMRRRRKLSAA